MADTSNIQWTRATWNPWHGCHKVSPGCDNCYMFTEKVMYGQNGDIVVRSKTKFLDPLKWVRSGNPPKMCFTCSWSDFFINAADAWRDEAWDIIRRTPQITYQILTKRTGRIASLLPADWGNGYSNVWLGVSVESPEQMPRMDMLRRIPARTRFVSFEPLLAEISFANLAGIDWAIAGGESGPKARPFDINWAAKLLDLCRAVGTRFFMKQIGSNPNMAGITVQAKGKGDNPNEWPKYLRVREYPAEVSHG